MLFQEVVSDIIVNRIYRDIHFDFNADNGFSENENYATMPDEQLAETIADDFFDFCQRKNILLSQGITLENICEVDFQIHPISGNPIQKAIFNPVIMNWSCFPDYMYDLHWRSPQYSLKKNNPKTKFRMKGDILENFGKLLFDSLGIEILKVADQHKRFKAQDKSRDMVIETYSFKGCVNKSIDFKFRRRGGCFLNQIQARRYLADMEKDNSKEYYIFLGEGGHPWLPDYIYLIPLHMHYDAKNSNVNIYTSCNFHKYRKHISQIKLITKDIINLGLNV